VISLLGPPQEPADGVLDHAHALSEALKQMGHSARVVQHLWDRDGWLKSLVTLRGRLISADRVLMHYTHLAWSRRGFPIMALVVAALVGRKRLWVLLHDPGPFPGASPIRRVRAAIQVVVMLMLVRFASRAYVTIHPSCVSWARGRTRNRLALLPVGSNVEVAAAGYETPLVPRPFTVAVFSITEGHWDEAARVGRVVTIAATMLSRDVRLCVFGKGVESALPWLDMEIGHGVELVASGVMSRAEIVAQMNAADVQLFIRAAASSRRSSLIAGIAHGVPVVAFAGPETCWPITEAGVDLVPLGDIEAAARGITRVARDARWAAQLRRKNETAYARYFSWDRIATALLDGGIRT